MASLPASGDGRFSSQFLNDDFQRGLACWNRRRLAPSLPGDEWRETLEGDVRMLRLEGAFLEELRVEAAGRASEAPEDPVAFVAWFEDLARTGRGQNDPLFPWLAQEAGLEEMRWFLAQEAAGEAGFEDLTAYTQIRMPERAKLELARNYWD